MKLLLVINNLNLGGAEKLVSLLAPRFVDRGIETSELVLERTESVLESSLQESGVVVMDTGPMSLYSVGQVPALARRIAQGRYDVVHVHLFPAQLWSGLATIFSADPPLVTTEHSTYNRRRKPYFRPADRFNYSRYRRIICVSDVVASEMTKWLPSTSKKIVVIPNGIALSPIRDAQPLEPQEIGIDTRPAILCVGRFVPEKDHMTLIRAFATLDRGILILAGDGPTKRDMEALATMLGVSKRVRFLGFRTDIPRLLKSADVFVQPSRWEGLSLSLLEAMAAGLPIIASTAPGVSDSVGEAGLLFEQANTVALAKRLTEVTQSDTLRTGLRGRSLRRSLDYDIEGTADKYAALYHEIVSGRSGV